MMEIGPVAVHPEFQGQGYGSKLMDTVENRSNAEKCTVGVVSCREDVIPFFIKRGYKVGTIYFLIISVCLLIELAGFFFGGKLKNAIFAKNREHSLYAQNGILFIGNMHHSHLL